MIFSNKTILTKIANEIEGYENKLRKQESLIQFEVFMDRMKTYVEEYLRTFYKEEDVKGLPTISSVNLARRIVKQEAGVYKHEPYRTFENVSDDQKAVLEQVYKDMNIDVMLQKSNEYFKLQAQNNIQIIPIDGKLQMRVLLNHHFDVIPRPELPEMAAAYILSGYDKSAVLPAPVETDAVNQEIADPDDYKSDQRIYVLWSDQENFRFDAAGNILDQDVENKIGILPFVDISPAKDFEFFVRQGSSVTDFTIQFNAALTDMSQIVRMQGFAQAYMIASETMMPQSIKVGPAIAIKMPVNPNQPEVRPEFGFAQPNADIGGSLSYIESLLAMFLTSRGLDPKTITASGDAKSFSSGMERLLSMIEKFEASRSDFAIYQYAEKKIFEIVKAYLNTYAGTDVLDYQIAPLSDAATISVVFEEPEMIETELDKLAEIEKKMDLGLMTRLEAIMYDREIGEVEAEKILEKINLESRPVMPTQAAQTIIEVDDNMDDEEDMNGETEGPDSN